MTLIRDLNKDEPICHKHNRVGYDCVQCHYEKYVTIERDHYLNILGLLKTHFEKAELTAGIEKTNELIKNATL